MKKLIFVTLAVILCGLVVAPAVMAEEEQPVDTTVTIDASSAPGPIVKAKWEVQLSSIPSIPYGHVNCWGMLASTYYLPYQPAATGYDHQPTVAGLQVAANEGEVIAGVPQIGESNVAYLAIVENSIGAATDSVVVDVFHPNVMKEVNINGRDPVVQEPGGQWCGSLKYKNDMFSLQEWLDTWGGMNAIEANAAEKAIWLQWLTDFGTTTDPADDSASTGLITLNDLQGNDDWQDLIEVLHSVTPDSLPTDKTWTQWMLDDIIYQFDNDLVDIYVGYGKLDNHQPAGDYDVQVLARSAISQTWTAKPCQNKMLFEDCVGIITDFTAIDYGVLAEGAMTYPVTGDGWPHPDYAGAMATAPPTVWNSGNTYVQLGIAQDDMGFDMRNGGTMWNVHYAARVGGAAAIFTEYDPACKKGFLDSDTPATPIQGMPLVMCTPTKMDFGIFPEMTNSITSFDGDMIIEAVKLPWTFCQ